MSSHFFTTRLISQDRVHRHYAYLIALTVTLATLFLLMKPATTPPCPVAIPLLTWGSPLCTGWTLLVLVLVTVQTVTEHGKQHSLSELLKFCSQAAVMLIVPVFYEGSNVVQRYRYSLFQDRMLFDSHLLRIDETVLGWLCPQGQLALCLDSHPLLGVKTAVGMVIAEVLQCMYVSYYFWGNGLGGWLAFRYFVSTQLLGRHNTVGRRRRQWRLIQMFLTAWVGGFLANFVLNMLFPAVSPRIHLHASYVNEIQGLFLANSLRSAIQGAAANTFSAFPSGHCGLSWLVPVFAHRMGYHRFKLITIVAAVLISSATLILRYHYFADLLFSVVVCAFGAWFGGFHTQSCYEQSVNGDQREEQKDRKGRRYEPDTASGLHSEEDEDELASRLPLIEVKVEPGNGAAANGSGLVSAAADGKREVGGVAGAAGGAGGSNGGSAALTRQLEGIAETGAEAEEAEDTDGSGGEKKQRLREAGDMIRLTSSSAVSRQSTGDKQLMQSMSRD